MVTSRSLLALVLLMAALPSQGIAQPVQSSAPLSVEDVVKLSKDGFSEDVIITKIKKNGKAFDLSPDELVELKKLGVADEVIKFLLDPSQPYVPPARTETAARPRTPGKKYPDDPSASKVPLEPGLYHFSGSAPEPIEIKLLLGETQNAGLGKVLMKKGKTLAYLVGPTSRNRVTETSPVFYLRLPEGKGIEEVLLVAFEPKNGRRELDMGPTGAKPELKAETMRQFDSLEVGAGLFRLTPANLRKGEYMFFLLSTAEPPKGNYGKGYDFGQGSAGPDQKKR